MTLLSLVQRVMNVTPHAITPADVRPSVADRDLGKEAQLHDQQLEFLKQYNRSVFLRKALANDALRIVAGD